MNLDEYNPGACVKAMVYGPPKSGKTALVGKLAEAGFKLHWCDLENGIKTLLNPAILKPEFRKNINVINIPDHRYSPTAITTINEVMKGRKTKICYDHGKVNCPICSKVQTTRWSEINLSEFTDKDILVIDSLSQLGESARNKVTLAEIIKPGGEEYKPTFNDYMAQGSQLAGVLSMIQVANLNIIVISHEIDVEKAETKEKIVPTSGTRNFSSTVGKYFDAVVHCEIVNKKHRAFSSSTYSPTILTGSRLPVGLDESKDGELSLLPLFQRT